MVLRQLIFVGISLGQRNTKLKPDHRTLFFPLCKEGTSAPFQLMSEPYVTLRHYLPCSCVYERDGLEKGGDLGPEPQKLQMNGSDAKVHGYRSLVLIKLEPGFIEP